jgi:hypothetical protein
MTDDEKAAPTEVTLYVKLPPTKKRARPKKEKPA